MENYLLISDAAKRVQVESHVLRYWEEELKLPIKRNEAGHRYYTDKDIERFLQIKSMKERGLQLKAIKMILKDGKLDVLPMENEEQIAAAPTELAIDIVPKEEVEPSAEESKEEKARRLQWLLKQLIRETLQENNKELSRDIKESVVKELDYQFRCQEERETEREMQRDMRNEEYYQRMDELLRKKSGRLRREKERAERKKNVKEVPIEDSAMRNAAMAEVAGREMTAKEEAVKEKRLKEETANSKAEAKVCEMPKKKRHLFS